MKVGKVSVVLKRVNEYHSENCSSLLYLQRSLGVPESRLEITGNFRLGDIRYAVADISRAAERLNWRPTVPLARGLAMLADWSRAEQGG